MNRRTMTYADVHPFKLSVGLVCEMTQLARPEPKTRSGALTFAFIVALFACANLTAGAQTNVTTNNGGQSGTIPYFTSGSNLENSFLSITGNTLNISGLTTFYGNLFVTYSGMLDYGGLQTESDMSDRINGAPWYGIGASSIILGNDPNATSTQLAGYAGLNFQTASGQMVMRADNGNVGIGTTSPGAKLEINGSLKLTQGTSASMTYADGSVQNVAWNGTTYGQDYAESINVFGDRSTYEPGDVIAIDPSYPGRFLKSVTPYSRLVAGVFSTQPGLLGRRSNANRNNRADEVPMAMMGIVPTKVTTENGSIEPGDLLVSSSVPGYAMKGTDKELLTGSVLGKALAPLKSGSGIIQALITLE